LCQEAKASEVADHIQRELEEEMQAVTTAAAAAAAGPAAALPLSSVPHLGAAPGGLQYPPYPPQTQQAMQLPLAHSQLMQKQAAGVAAMPAGYPAGATVVT